MRPQEKKLLRFFSELPSPQQETLLAFAEFLHGRLLHEKPELTVPQLISRPASESVVGAIKRLSASYPMLNRGPLFNETSSLMAAHVMGGKPAVEVIDQLEQLFSKHYDLWYQDNLPKEHN